MTEARLLQDTIMRVLDSTPNGLTVETIRSRLATAGAGVRKWEVVQALADMNARQLVQLSAGRRWQARERPRRGEAGPASSLSVDDYIVGVRCQAFAGEAPVAEPEMQEGRIEPGPDLLRRLLPYYQEALKANDGGQPGASTAQHGDTFMLIEPDKQWWPTAERGRTLTVPLSGLPVGFRSLAAKRDGGRLLLGYPLHMVTARDGEDSASFLRPVSVFRCRFDHTDSHLRIHVPAVGPAIVRDWLRDQVKYKGWEAARLLRWLRLEEDDDRGVGGDDEPVEDPDFLEVPSFIRRLEAVAGKTLHQELLPGAPATRIPRRGETGHYNGLALFVESAGMYTRSAIRDYDRLCGVEAQTLASTALGPLFGSPVPPLPAVPLMHPFPLGEAQLLAARTGLTSPLSVVTGPPGTGKSQVIAAIMLSAAASGRSVLLAARLHRAIDAVQERLEAMAGDRTVLVRANAPDGMASFSFAKALDALLVRSGDAGAADQFDRMMPALSETDARRWDLLDKWRGLKALSAEQGALLAEAGKVAAERSRFASSGWPPDPAREPGAIRRWLLKLARLLGLLGRPLRASLGPEFRHAHFDREEERIKARLRDNEGAIRALQAELDDRADTPVGLGEKIEEMSAALLPRLLARLDSVAQDDRQALSAIAGDAAVLGRHAGQDESHALVLKHMPLWAVTTLAAGSRIPLEPGLFDYVVFDEAAATDIASAIPLLFRARAAVVVGDPMQLGLIGGMDAREEGRILARENLKRPGIGGFLQSRTSLFQLAASALDEPPMLLNEHYRCHPDIAAYFNEAFYGNRLAALTDASRLRVPRGFRPGLHWTDVEGPVSSGRGIGMAGSAYSDPEAEAVVRQLGELLETGFEGSVGVVTFFAPQARRINELATQQLGAAALDRMQVKVFTANRFQGDERDVMLLSLCLATDMPAGARHFLKEERRLLNVAVSRARAVCHIFGNRSHARQCGIPHIETLVRRVDAAAAPRDAKIDDRFESPWEQRLYEVLLENGFHPMPQHPAGGRFLDLAIVEEDRSPPLHLDIEVDGAAFHTDADGNRLATDLWRDHQLRGLGWKVLRFWVHELRDDMGGCLERVRAAAGR